MAITIRKILRTGDSLAVVIPKPMLELLELHHGDQVAMVARERDGRHLLELVKVTEESLLGLRARRARGSV